MHFKIPVNYERQTTEDRTIVDGDERDELIEAVHGAVVQELRLQREIAEQSRHAAARYEEALKRLDAEYMEKRCALLQKIDEEKRASLKATREANAGEALLEKLGPVFEDLGLGALFYGSED